MAKRRWEQPRLRLEIVRLGVGDGGLGGGEGERVVVGEK